MTKAIVTPHDAICYNGVMSFLSDLGSIAKEFMDVRDEITHTVTDAATQAIAHVTEAKDDVASSVQSAVDDVAAVRDDVAEGLAGVKDTIAAGAQQTIHDITASDTPKDGS